MILTSSTSQVVVGKAEHSVSKTICYSSIDDKIISKQLLELTIDL